MHLEPSLQGNVKRRLYPHQLSRTLLSSARRAEPRGARERHASAVGRSSMCSVFFFLWKGACSVGEARDAPGRRSARSRQRTCQRCRALCLCSPAAATSVPACSAPVASPWRPPALPPPVPRPPPWPPLYAIAHGVVSDAVTLHDNNGVPCAVLGDDIPITLTQPSPWHRATPSTRTVVGVPLACARRSRCDARIRRRPCKVGS